MSNLVIVESPTKARTLAKFLGNKYRIEASMGHIRDLPKGALGIDIAKNFEPEYVIPKDKKKKVGELKKLAKDATSLWLATDPDREGEAIAWHLAHIFKADKGKGGKDQKIQRVEFHEITEEAIKDAFSHPREINFQLVDAQQARRVLDRLVGYKLSPLLWKKIKSGLSAGRVQTVALRLITEREREITVFTPIEYWSIEAVLETVGQVCFTVGLIELDGKKLEIKSEQEASVHMVLLETAQYQVAEVTKKEVRRLPAAPFTTSTLQQTAGNRLGLSAKRTMMLAQNLYEHGLITYMRTDSVNLSNQAVDGTRRYITAYLGNQYLPARVRIFKSKSKNAQEAHEAIRPTNVNILSDQVDGSGFTRDHKRLYDLIWKRTVASQMADAIFDQTSIDVSAQVTDNRCVYTLRTTGSVIKFDGWLKLYGVPQEIRGKEAGNREDENREEEAANQEGQNQILPALSENDRLKLKQLLPEQHFTQPPPRYTEAGLIKKLEELGIGRPSTYAPILSTIQERFYVEREERKFVPTALGFTVADFLIKYFPDVFDYEFTALMEDQLDDIALGGRNWKETISTFYKPLEKKLETTLETAEKVVVPVEVSDKDCPQCGKKLIVRTGKFGKFLACSGFPDCKHTEALEEIINVKCPEDGAEIIIRKTRKGRVFYGCKNWPKCKFASWTKPK